MEAPSFNSTATRIVAIWSHLLLLLLALGASQSSDSRTNPTTGPNYFNRSDFYSWIQPRLGQGPSSERPSRLAPPSHHRPSSGYAIEVTPPPNNQLLQYQSATPKRDRVRDDDRAQVLSPQSAPVAILSANRSARTAAVAAATSYDEPADGDDLKLLVSNTCEPDHMLVEIRTSKPFHGLVHTLNYRRKLLCTAEGDGGMLLKLSISHSLNPSDPQHCGVTRVAHSKADDRSGELLSVIVAVRLHRNIELSEDKFFALNCTNHCRRSDCSSGPSLASGKLINELARQSDGWRHLERDYPGDEAHLLPSGRRSQPSGTNVERGAQVSECSVWRSAWMLALILCLAIILIGMLISNCIICMSLRQNISGKNRPVAKSQKEATDVEGQQVKSRERGEDPQRRKSRRKSRQIIYDNDDLNYFLGFPDASKRAGQPDYLALQKQQQDKLNRSQVAQSSRQSGETSREHR